MSTFVNPRPQPVRVFLSDGSHRTVGPWGLVFLPETLRMTGAEYAEREQSEQRERTAGPQAAEDRRSSPPRRAA